MGFFKDFSFDTLLAIISCITGIVALFIGGTAYKNCKMQKDLLNDKKKFGDNCEDNSQKAGRDIVNNNGIDNNQLISITNALSTMNSSNFSEALDKAYCKFQEQCDNNLEKIIQKTSEIVAGNKLQIGSYSKLDWIHIYFESAKNSSDEYMQAVWAKVLARELSHPDSFSYKTLDTLKNMSSDDFKLFEKLCSCEVDGFIFSKSTFYDKYDLFYIDYLKLNEQGLLNVKESQRQYRVTKRNSTNILYGDKLIIIGNGTDNDIRIDLSAYPLTSIAKELKTIIDTDYSIQRASEFMNELHNINNNVHISLHKIRNQNGDLVNINPEELYSI